MGNQFISLCGWSNSVYCRCKRVIWNRYGIGGVGYNQDCRMHGVGENLKLELVEKGLEFSYRFLSKGI